ncbi:MAG: exo-alpha-sialidase [Burkholderiales bacterium]|nr:exo-alpha-sialidase [Burkholderiales bacterium]
MLGDPVTAVLDDPRDGTLYAALNLGHFGVKLRRSDDDGKTWEELEPPTYPPQPDDAEGPPWKLVQLWCLEPGGVDQPSVLWAGTIPGGLFRSADRGATWKLIRSLWDRPERLGWFGGGYDAPGIHSVMVDPRDSRIVTIGVSCGGVWRTENGGDSWRLCADGMRAGYMPPEQAGEPNIQDPHRVVACRDRPDVLWTQHHSGIFRSEDASASWSEVHATPSSFGFAVAVHPKDPDIAWFVPAVRDELRVPVDGRFVVTRTRDGGRSFEALTRGLPAAPSFDLVYRHCLDVDSTGSGLAMGSTTGNLWVSEDQGDSWFCISTHLPPIYAVRISKSDVAG